ncbi:MAG TPA: hypothetical protein VGQ21_13900 [Thermoanaerobaculia bacterium]|nr:hypothetical protein [Thermoanaerobaculia bacterium]
MIANVACSRCFENAAFDGTNPQGIDPRASVVVDQLALLQQIGVR